jgi:hypothetical protein
MFTDLSLQVPHGMTKLANLPLQIITFSKEDEKLFVLDKIAIFNSSDSKKG